MKIKVTNVIKTIVFVVLLIACILAVMVVTKRKESDYKYADFFELAKKDQIDVLFLGSSHVINAINPATLYRDYGITSYNMGGHGSVMQATYWELIESLDYCKPKWVVVDAYMLEKNYKYLDVMDENTDTSLVNTSIEQLHLNMDTWPLNRLKKAAIDDLVLDKDIKNQFLFDFIIYHDRWSELDSNDYRALTGTAEKNALFGAEMRYKVEQSPASYSDPEAGQVLSEHTVGAEYLMKIIDECQRQNIGVLVTYLPFCATTEDKIAANTAATVADMYDVPYINMLGEDIIDLRTDLNDSGHLNVSGAVKVTDYLGTFLSETGDFTDHRGDSAYSRWQENTDAFYDELKDMIAEEENLYTLLDVLSLDECSYVVYFNQGCSVFHDDTARKIVSNMAGTDEIYKANGPYILIKDLATGTAGEAFDEGGLENVPTALGTMVYQPVEARFRFLYPLENEELNYLYDDEHTGYDIQIIAYEKESGEIISQRYFRSYGNNYRVD